MATTTDQLTVKIAVDTKGAEVGFQALNGKIVDFNGKLLNSKNVADIVEKKFVELGDTAKAAFVKSSQGSEQATQSLNSFGFKALEINAILDLGKKAYEAIKGAVNETVGVYLNAEKSQLRLAGAIKFAGDRVNNSAEAWSAYLEAIERVTGADADNLKGITAQAFNLGLNEKQTRALIEASLKLAKVQGTTVEESAQALIGSYKGVAKELKLVIPELRGLGEQQQKVFLEGGGAIDALNKKYKDLSIGAKGLPGALAIQGKAFEDLQKDIGKAFAEFLGLEERTKSITKVIYELKDALADVDFKKLRESAEGFVIALVSVGLAATALSIVFQTKLGASIIALVVKNAAALVSFLPYVAVAAGFLAAAAAVEALALNIDHLPELAEAAFNKLLEMITRFELMLTKAGVSVANFFGDKTLADEKVKKIGELEAAITSYGAKAKEVSKNLNFGFTGAALDSIKTAYNSLTGDKKEKPVAKEKADKLADSGKNGREAELDRQAIIEKIKAVKDSIFEIDQKTFAINANAYQLADKEFLLGKVSLENKIKELVKVQATKDQWAKIGDLSTDEIIKRGLLTKEQDKLYQTGLKALEAQKGKTKLTAYEAETLAKDIELRNKEIEIYLKNKDLQEQINQWGMTQYETAVDNARIENQKLQILIDQAKARGLQTEEMEKQQSLNMSKAKQTPLSAGDAGGGLGEAFKGISNLLAGSAGAVMSAANGILDGIQSMIDFIPGVLTKVAGIFNSLTDLPNAIAKGIGGVLDSLINFVTNFIPNLAKQIPKIIARIADFLAKGLPDAFNRLVDALPQLAVSLVEGIVKALPRLFTALVSLMVRLPIILIRAIPGMIIALIKGIPEFIKGLVIGLIDAFKEAFTGIASDAKKLFTGIFGSSIQSGLDKAGDGIRKLSTGVSDAIFKVADMANIKKSNTPLENARAAANEIGRRGRNIAQRIWDFLVENFQKGLKALKQLGTWIWHGLTEAWDASVAALKRLGTWLWDGVSEGWAASIGAIKRLGTFLWSGVTEAFEASVAALARLGSWIWEGFLKPIGNFFVNLGSDIWGGMVKAAKSIGNFFGDFGRQIWEGLKSMFSGIGDIFKGVLNLDASGAIEGVKNAFGGIFDSFKSVFRTIFNPIIDLINNLKIPEMKFTAPSWLGGKTWKLWSEIDLIPGNIAHLNQGGLVQGFGERDTQKAMLTPGEFVMKRESVNSIGLNTLNAMNAGRMPAQQSSTSNVSLNLTLNASKNIDPSYVRDTLMPTIREELRRESRRGGYILASGGVRS